MLLYFLVAHRRRCRIGFEPVFRTTCGFYECEKQLLQLADAVLVGNHPAVGMRYIGDIEIEDRFLEYYSNAPEIEIPSTNDRRSERGSKERKDHGSAREKTERKAEKGYTRLFLNVGKTDGFYANQIIELINRNMKKQRTTIGRIDLMQNFSFFEVAENQAQDVIKALNKVNLNGGRKIVVEVAGDNNGKNDNGERRSSAARNASFGKKSDRSNKKTTSKEGRPSRAERGYIEERGPKTKDDWKQFFNSDNNKKKKSKK